MTYLEQDKKRVDSKLRLVLVKSIGDCYVEEVNLKDFKAKILNHDDFKNF
jgi:3-dehydroquinate synthetase